LSPSLFALALAGCGSISSSPSEIDSIAPESATNDVPVPVEILGSFPIVFTSDLDTGTHGGSAVSATIGSTTLRDVQRRDDMRITATVPNGIPPGIHDVTVMIGSRSAVLSGGYSVVGASLLAGLSVPTTTAAGATFTIRMTVSNSGETAATMTEPSVLMFGGIAPTLVTAPSGGVTVVPNGSVELTWTYQAGAAGTFSVRGGASGIDELTGIVVMSNVPSTSGTVQ
jgi:hypothetical protein